MKRINFKWKKIYKANNSYSSFVFTEKLSMNMSGLLSFIYTQLVNFQLSPANHLVGINEVT